MLEFKEIFKKLEFPHRNFSETSLLKYFLNNDKRVISKWLHYFEVYEFYFDRLRGKPFRMLEIGVNRGGSMQMWKEYFGDQVEIVGVDISPGCKNLEEEQIQIRIGDQGDQGFLRSIKEEYETFDVIIDDGSHFNDHQILTFKELFSTLTKNGIYVCEDCHTSYWDDYRGGYKDSRSFIEFSKELIDQVNAYHSKSKPDFSQDFYTRNIEFIHFYDSMVVFKRSRRSKPFMKKTGQIDWKL